ncbi:MAG: serine hydrolase [candidate division Zixibacteria bacterium]|nr:serine hydrolase [candidate division Zixibacteria bacterium]MDH3938552.1 serine hydrolase [candidate division Zixibacteria bacterium]MDH4034695.1 serine hydrolase [candidate division Zixibacteria bacterium]
MGKILMSLVDNLGMTRVYFWLKFVTVVAVVLLVFTAGGGYLEPLSASGEAVVATGYRFDFDHVKKGPWLNAKAALLVNYENGEVLFARNADKVRSIASISKLVTAMVVLDRNIDMNRVETITKEDARRSSRSRLRVGSKLALHDLLDATLASSDNRAARALARAVAGNCEEFAKLMNAKVLEMGLEHTSFYEPTGLDARNVSSAHEVARILHYAYDYELIAKITSGKQHPVQFANLKYRTGRLPNTNRLLWSRYNVEAGKTGFIQAADYCVTSIVRNKQGERLTLVLLGVPGDRLRFKEAGRLLKWGFNQVQ